MSTLLVRSLRLGWLGSILLTLLAVAALGIAVVVAAANPAAAGSATGTSQPATVSVAVTTTTVQVLPTDLSHWPAPDHEFIAVAVHLTNAGSRVVDYRVSAFALRDREGTTFAPDPAASDLVRGIALPLEGSLGRSDRRDGAIVFEVPMSVHTATLLWQPAGFTIGDSTTWVLSI